jgi:hypothetical protein
VPLPKQKTETLQNTTATPAEGIEEELEVSTIAI